MAAIFAPVSPGAETHNSILTQYLSVRDQMDEITRDTDQHALNMVAEQLVTLYNKTLWSLKRL